jgi:hypothetical protein
MGTLPRPFFVGFLAKRVVRRPDWLDNPIVREICSVSECISEGAPDRIDSWTHNKLGLYDTPDLARKVIPAEQAASYELFSYRLYPIAFDVGGMSPDEELTGDLPEPDLAGWSLVGYDLVGRSERSYFECSPLSCNHFAESCSVNAFCLIDDLAQAIQTGLAFGDYHRSGVEPGPYYLVEVLREPAKVISRLAATVRERSSALPYGRG